MLCSRCSERPAIPDRAWCRRCRELQVVYEHQLHKRREWARRFVGHTCALCRKHKLHVKLLLSRWDKRDVWVTKQCPAGHLWQKRSENGRCDTCAEEIGRRCLKLLKLSK